MRFPVYAAVLLTILGSLNSCSSSSSAQGPSTIVVRLPGTQFSIENLTPLNPAAVLYESGRDTWVTDYTGPGTQLLMSEMSILTSLSASPGLRWNGNTFLIETDAFDSNSTSTAEIWMTDGTLAGTVLLETLNPTSQMFELLGAELEGDALVVAFRLNQPGVPSVFATYIERIAL